MHETKALAGKVGCVLISWSLGYKAHISRPVPNRYGWGILVVIRDFSNVGRIYKAFAIKFVLAHRLVDFPKLSLLCHRSFY
jgi:hypothetical protein